MLRPLEALMVSRKDSSRQIMRLARLLNGSLVEFGWTPGSWSLVPGLWAPPSPVARTHSPEEFKIDRWSIEMSKAGI